MSGPPAGVYVFLGPSVPVEQARTILDATYLPPVAMGDVQALMAEGPRAIAIIDGLFERIPAVWHKEILHALAQGVRVYGASSMGALRAAELHTFGMIGVGRIFEAYRDGVLEDDDEVALVHAPAAFGYRAGSEPMVNLRWGLGQAEARGCVSAATRAALEAAAKETFYPDRSWAGLQARGLELGLPPGELAALREYVGRERPDLKRADALELLERLAAEVERGLTPHVPSFELHETYFWPKMVESAERYRARMATGEAGKTEEADRG